MTETLKQRILRAVEADLIRIETALKHNLGAHLDLVEQAAGHILFAGGKRLRPLLMILSARLCGYAGDRAAFFSTIFEYLHAATLIHDDVVDGGVLRRGKPAAHTLWGSPIAVLTGDFLLARSLSIAAETENPRVIRIIAGITENMSQGEIQQLTRKSDPGLTEAEYFEIIRRKTAVLIQGACTVGALIAGASEARVEALSGYGCDVGMAFQIVDDLLDYVSDTATLGKGVGADLREGKLTLPVIRARGRAAPDDRERMEKILLKQDVSDAEFAGLKDLLNRYHGIEDARIEAGVHVARARKRLDIFEESETRRLLMDIGDYAMLRSA